MELGFNTDGLEIIVLESHGEKMNKKHLDSVGSDGISVIPFGNGAERMLNNKNIGTHICNINLNKHSLRSPLQVLLGRHCLFFYVGWNLENDNDNQCGQSSNDNLFRSEIFTHVSTLIGHEIEIYNTTGAFGAARASGILNNDLNTFREKITRNDHVMTFLPLKNKSEYEDAYSRWKEDLQIILKNK